MELKQSKQEIRNLLCGIEQTSSEDELITKAEKLIEKVNAKLTTRKIELIVISKKEYQEAYQEHLAEQYREAVYVDEAVLYKNHI